MDELPFLFFTLIWRIDQCFYFFQTFLLDIDIIVVGNAVYTYYFDALYIAKKSFDKVAANKACGSRYEDGLAFKTYILSNMD